MKLKVCQLHHGDTFQPETQRESFSLKNIYGSNTFGPPYFFSMKQNNFIHFLNIYKWSKMY